MMLAIYYLLIGKYNLSEEEITQRFEPYMHLVAILPPVVLAIAGLPLKLYNNANLWCGTALARDSDGEHAHVVAVFNIVTAVIVWLIIAVITVTMGILTLSIREEEKNLIELKRKNDPDSSRLHNVPLNLERSRKMFHQSLFYLGAFYLTWLFPTVNRLVQIKSGKSYFIVILATVTFLPLQGFFNFLIYRRGPCVA